MTKDHKPPHQNTTSAVYKNRRPYIPHRSRHVPEHEWQRPYHGPIKPHWQDLAKGKGFDIVDRVHDRYHLVLRCHQCGADTPHKIHVICSARPRCGACLGRQLHQHAKACGYQLIERDYCLYRPSSCGHAQSIAVINMITGHTAQKAEKRLHNQLKHRFPDRVVAREELAGWIKVTSDIYRPEILPQIMALLEAVADRFCPDQNRGRSKKRRTFG